MAGADRDALKRCLRHPGKTSLVRLRDDNGAVLNCELSGFPVPGADGALGTVVRMSREELLRSARRESAELAESTLESGSWP